MSSFSNNILPLPNEAKEYVFRYFKQKKIIQTSSFTEDEEKECIKYEFLHSNKINFLYLLSTCSSHTNYYILIVENKKYKILNLIEPNDNIKIIQFLNSDRFLKKQDFVTILTKIFRAANINYTNSHQYQPLKKND